MSNHSLIISSTPISQDDNGRYCLNDLHKAAGDELKHKPANWLRLDQTKALIDEIDRCSDVSNAVKVMQGGIQQGTFVVKELVYAYAMWISPAFTLQVIRAYDALANTNQGLNSPITTPITLEEFQQRHETLSTALAALLKAPVILTGQDALAITRNNTKPTGTYRDYRNDWTADEIEKLITLTAQGFARTEIYRQMPSRTTQAIGKKINLLIRQGKLTLEAKAGAA
jgi:hypothetical protein